MVSVTDWHLERNGIIHGVQQFIVRTGELSVCPICSGVLIKKGMRPRYLVKSKPGATEDDRKPYKKICLFIQRYRCKECGRIHHELPDCIVPYKRHSLEIIEGIIRDPSQPSLIDEDTIKKIISWWALMVSYILGVAPSIEEKYRVEITPDEKLVKIVRALANSHLWPRTRSYFKASG